MSTIQTTTLNRLSSILLALRRMRRPSPEKILHHLDDPVPSDDYYYLDALATLCSFVAQCDSVSAVVEHDTQSNRLYLATSPSPPSTLRDQLPAWIDLIQKLRSTSPSSSETGGRSELEGSLNHNTPTQNFIIEVYRVCHAKLLDVVKRDNDGQKLLDHIFAMSPRQLRWSNITMEGESSVVANIRLLISMGKQDAKSLSAEDLLRLHEAAKVVAQFKHTFEPTTPTFVYDADRLSQAVDDIVTFATSGDHDARINLPWTVVWVDVPGSAPKFLATTNEHELAGMVGKGLYDDLVSRQWSPFDPSRAGLGDVRMVEGSPGHFTGHGVVHCESALLQYIVGNQLSVEPYIGCSRPICYACVMLVKAYNEVSGKDFGAGCRCIDLAQLDIAWSYPPAMGLAVYRRLENGVRKDFNQLFTQPIYSAYRPIVKVPWTSELSGSGGP